MDYSSLATYMRSLPKTEGLDRETEVELARKSKLAGEEGEAARHIIVETNLKMVIAIAKDHQHMGVELEDLIAEGNIGLLKAVERFNPEVGCRLSTYASWWIREAIKAAVTHQSRTIRVPKKTLSKIGKVRHMLQELSQELGREPTLEELSGETEIAVHKLERLISWDARTISADSKKTPEGQKLIETIIDEACGEPWESTARHSDGEWIERLLEVLTEQERQIIESRFGWNGPTKTLKEIGEEFGITRERVRQIEGQVLKKLKQRAAKLESLLGT